MKTLRRQIIIREEEYIAPCVKFAKNNLYDRADFDTVIYSHKQHYNLLALLKNPSRSSKAAYDNNTPVYQILIDHRSILYNSRYLKWDSYRKSETGDYWIRPICSDIEDRLVLATFEKDLP
jgi:hypothetical protein